MESEIAQDVSEVSEVDALKTEIETLKGLLDDAKAQLDAAKGASMAEGDEEEKEDEDSEKMAEGDDDKEDDEKDSEKLSERLLLREQASQIRKLQDALGKIKRQASEERMKTKITALCESGRVAPSEVPQAERLYKLDRKLFSEMFESSAPSSSVDLGEYGHGYGAEAPTRQGMDQEIKTLAAQQKCSYSEAMAIYQAKNPQQFSKIMRG